jgi:anti-anti-sigma regulatory factor
VTSRPNAASGRSALAVHLELSHGRHGATASVAFHDTESGTLACVAVRGWIEAVAARRWIEVLEDLARRGVTHLEIEASGVRHADLARVGQVLGALDRLEARGVTWSIRGLSVHLRDRFLIAGWDPRHDAASPRRALARVHGTAGGWAP